MTIIVLPFLAAAPTGGLPAEDVPPSEVLRGVRAFFQTTAREDGSFRPGIDPEYQGMSDSAASDLAPVAYAVILHRTFGWELPHAAATRLFLLSRQRDDGAFFNVQGTMDPNSAQGRCYNTTQGVVALRALGVKPKHDPIPVLAAILEEDYRSLPPYSTSFFPLAYLAHGSLFPPGADRKLRALMVQAPDGYLNDHIAATFHAVHYYRLLGEATPKAQAILERTLEDQRPNGSWLLNPPARDRHATFDAVFVLKQLGGASGRPDCSRAIRRAAEWALTCRNADGGFGHFPGSQSDADAVYFQAGTLVMAGVLEAAAPLPPDARLLGWGHLFPAAEETSKEDGADLILHGGKVVAADRAFSIHEALAIRGGRIAKVGSSAEVVKLRGPKTDVVDLEGKMVLPGLIDSHVHPTGASMTEFDHPIPEMQSIQDVLDYIRSRAALLEKGKWITVRQVFITRLREQRYPTREELDAAAPEHPVVFATGPDASLNTLALKLSGIDSDFRVADGGQGHAEKDPRTGEPSGILRSCTRYVKSAPSERTLSAEDRLGRLRLLLRDYNSVGLTAIGDRDADGDDVDLYRNLRDEGDLTLRVFISHHIDTIGPIEQVLEAIRKVAAHPLRKRDALLRIGGIKTYLDGGMLTGSAYMGRPWGVSKIYSITDPEYRGVLFIPRERLLPIVRTAVEHGLQFTAHSVGDGAVHLLLGVYEEINRTLPIRETRPCITHSNFMSREAVELLPRLGVVVDIQPAWLYLDTRTLVAQFGEERLRYFQPLRSIFEAGGIAGGGSDHMQKIGSLRSINPYNPFLGMWTTITRKSRGHEGALHPEEALTREQAVRFYTGNNAYILDLDSETGSLEEGKLADLVILDTDILTCPVDAIRETKVLATYLAGKAVYRRQ